MRHVALTARSFLATTLVLATSTLIGVAVASATSAALRPTTQTVVTPDLVEVPVCWGTSTTADTLPSSDGAMVQTITVAIEPTSLLRLDADGRVSAAATNTGCAPRPTDHLFVVQGDGSLRDATGFDVGAVAWTGDFREWGFVPQG